MGAVECWPTRLTYLDRGGIQRTLQPGTLTGSGCPLVLWGGDDRRVGRLFTDAWVSTDAGKTWASQGDNLYQGSGNAGYSISPTSRMVKVGGSYGSSVVSNAVNPSTGARDASVYESSYWSNPGPGARSFPQITFNTRGDLYMVGGYITSGDAGNIRGDVWRSARDDCCGFWERQGDLPAPRASGFLLFLSGLNANNAQDKLLYLGGISTTGASNDVYLTVDGGYSWVTMEQAPWRGRWNQNAEVHPTPYPSTALPPDPASPAERPTDPLCPCCCSAGDQGRFDCHDRRYLLRRQRPEGPQVSTALTLPHLLHALPTHQLAVCLTRVISLLSSALPVMCGSVPTAVGRGRAARRRPPTGRTGATASG